MKSHSTRFLAVLAILATPLCAEVKLASPFTSHMVLQREMKVPVWGTAAAGERVTVEFAAQQKSTAAGADGKWRVDLDALATSADGREFTVTGSQTAAPVKLDDVLVGEVWLGSGQSNMVFVVSKARGRPYGLVNEAEEIAAANYPKIRMFTARDTKTYEPQASVAGEWEVCSPETVPGFSAVGYLFARDLQKELNVPVGILLVASGASCAEAWMSREALTADASLKFMLDSLDACESYFRAAPETRPAVAPLHPTPINKPRTPPRGGRGEVSDPARDQHFASVLFNGMLNPVIPYAIRGALWYQGESICWGTRGLDLYGHVLRAMIGDWRARWGEGDFPLYLVQLPGQQNISNNPLIREQQASVLSLPQTAMAVTIDLGEAKDVHPHNKEPLGERLTRIALANVYGRPLEFSGPIFASMQVEGAAARIHFTHLGGGLVAKGGPLKGFQVAGADQRFVDADARIDGDTLLVSAATVSSPVAVRYAWDNFPEGLGCNLTNAAGLPAAPFRTDHWDYPIPGIVED